MSVIKQSEDHENYILSPVLPFGSNFGSKKLFWDQIFLFDFSLFKRADIQSFLAKLTLPRLFYNPLSSKTVPVGEYFMLIINSECFKF